MVAREKCQMFFSRRRRRAKKEVKKELVRKKKIADIRAGTMEIEAVPLEGRTRGWTVLDPEIQILLENLDLGMFLGEKKFILKLRIIEKHGSSFTLSDAKECIQQIALEDDNVRPHIGWW